MINKTILIICGILICILLINTCRLSRKVSFYSNQITKEKLVNQKLGTLINTKNQVIYNQEVLLTSSKENIDELTDSIFNLKKNYDRSRKTIAFFQKRGSVQLKEVYIPYVDTVYSDYSSYFNDTTSSVLLNYIKDSTIKVGTVAIDSNKNYSIKQTLYKSGIVINSLSIPDTLNLRFVENKRGLFKRKKIEVQYFHTNPFIHTTSSNSVFYVPKRKSFFLRVALPFGIGVAGGIFIANKIKKN